MSLQSAVSLYNEAWGEAQEQRRRELLSRAWSDAGVYTDPTTVAQGRDELVALMGAVQQQFPGMRIEQSSALEEHHDAFMFTWDLVIGQNVVISGRDFGFRSDDGLIRNLTCFYALPVQTADEQTAAIA